MTNLSKEYMTISYFYDKFKQRIYDYQHVRYSYK